MNCLFLAFNKVGLPYCLPGIDELLSFQQHAEARWLGGLRVEVRAYHDAGMLEVGSFQSHRRIQPRYNYPNEQMHQQDEKSQQNRFLADWLEHCLGNGHSSQPVSLGA